MLNSSDDDDVMPEERLELARKHIAEWDVDFKDIGFIPMGREYRRVPTPTGSKHSNEGDPVARGKDVATYAKERNLEVGNYLMRPELEESVPTEESWQTAQQQEKRLKRERQDRVKSENVNDVVSTVTYARTSGTVVSGMENPARLLNSAVIQIVNGAEADLLGLLDVLLPGQMEVAEGITFSQEKFQKCLNIKWKNLGVYRMKKLFEGKYVPIEMPPKWYDKEFQLEKLYGPMDKSTAQFQKMAEELTRVRFETAILILQSERRLLNSMKKQGILPSECPGKSRTLYKIFMKSLKSVEATSEANRDTNPYTCREKMDFWVMPRPSEIVDVYDIRAEEMAEFVEFNVPVDEINRYASIKDAKQSMFIQNGYNAAVFDVGWHYYPLKVSASLSRKEFFKADPPFYCDPKLKKKEHDNWESTLLQFRKFLGESLPFGVEMRVFTKRIRDLDEIFDEMTIFGGRTDEDGFKALKDVFYRQKLDDKRVILFDALLEGQILTPKEMLLKLWKRVRFLIEEQPEQVLMLAEMQEKYEDCFAQPFFVLKWGFKDVQEFVQYALEQFPEDPASEGVSMNKKKDRMRVNPIKDDFKYCNDENEAEDEEMLEKYEHLFESEWIPVEKNEGVPSPTAVFRVIPHVELIYNM